MNETLVKAVRPVQCAHWQLLCPSLLTGKGNETSTPIPFAMIKQQQQEGQYDDDMTTSHDHNSAQGPQQQTCNVMHHALPHSTPRNGFC